MTLTAFAMPVSYFAPVDSYDFHIYYHYKSPVSRREAVELKNKIVRDFRDEIDRDLIILKVLRNEEIRGPHITSYFEVDVEDAATFVKFFSWIQLNHGTLSVLVHPNTGDAFKDHTSHAAWLGEKLPLLLETLKGATAVPFSRDFGFPSREFIGKGFYDDYSQYSKRTVIRLLEQGPEDDFYQK